MFEIDPEKVCFIIAMAREFEAPEGAVEDEYSDDEPSGEMIRGADSEADATYSEVKNFINTLNWDEQCQLVALAWTGRGDFSKDEWDEAFKIANDEHNDRTAQYLLGMPLLPDYLTEGLAVFDISCDERD